MSGRWMRLDNAALIFPAVRRQRWNNVFRQSVTLTDPIVPALLQRAVDDLPIPRGRVKFKREINADTSPHRRCVEKLERFHLAMQPPLKVECKLQHVIGLGLKRQLLRP